MKKKITKPNNPSELVETLSEIASKEREGYANNIWLRAAIQEMPFGSIFDTAIFGGVDERRRKRVEDEIVRLGERLTKLEKFIDIEYIQNNTEEYASLFEKYFSIIAFEYRKISRKRITISFANLLTKTYSIEENKEILLNKVALLKPIHFDLLINLFAPSPYLFNKKFTTFYECFRRYSDFKQIDIAISIAALKDLETNGMISNYGTVYPDGIKEDGKRTLLGIKILYLTGSLSKKFMNKAEVNVSRKVRDRIQNVSGLAKFIAEVNRTHKVPPLPHIAKSNVASN